MIAFEKFVAAFRDAQEGLVRDYARVGDAHTELCEVMHHELRLYQTPVHDAEERAALLKANDMDIEADSIKLSQEHAELHELLNQVRAEAIGAQLSSHEFMALMFILGRRYGLQEAAALLDQDLDDASNPDRDLPWED